MIVHNCKQGDEEWLQLRLGIPTASEFDRILTPAKLQLAAASKAYMHLKVAEWMYGAPLETYDVGAHGWGARGKELEPEAVRYYEMERECETAAVGLVTTDDGMIGASPDRLVGEDGLYEGKAPALETHVGYMLDPQSLVDEYRLQVQGQLWVCHRAWCDMHSYSPGFPSVIVRVLPDERVQKALAQHVPAFVETMLKCREVLTERYGELRRERVRAEQRLEASRAAFDAFMDSQIGGVV
jgi:hypothetical protein